MKLLDLNVLIFKVLHLWETGKNKKGHRSVLCGLEKSLQVVRMNYVYSILYEVKNYKEGRILPCYYRYKSCWILILFDHSQLLLNLFLSPLFCSQIFLKFSVVPQSSKLHTKHGLTFFMIQLLFNDSTLHQECTVHEKFHSAISSHWNAF